MSTVDTVTSQDGTSIAYSRAGSGPALVLVDPAGSFRGFGANLPLAAALTESFTVVSYDRRGRGESTDTLPYAVDREVEDLRAVLDATGGPAFVYGFSSGAVLAMHAAAAGLPIPRLAVLEPPLALDGEPQDEPDLGAEIADLVAAGRRAEAVEHFHNSIGVPPELVAQLRDHPAWPALQALAHTLVYDTRVTASMTAERLATITVPTLIINSAASDDRLRAWAKDAARAMPDASHRELPGEWHGVDPEILVPALTEFFMGQTW